MQNNCEPWNDSYELDGETERLLRRLQEIPLSEDQIRRFCLKEVDFLLSPAERAELESEMIEGAARLLTFDLRPFANAGGRWEKKREQLREELDWSEVPQELRELTERRAQCVLNYASENGWIEQRETEGRWSITESGRKMLEQGGFNMR